MPHQDKSLNYKQKLLLRHKNPIGLLLRVVSYLTLGIAIWHHSILIVTIAILVDLANWFLMPMIKPEHENERINRIVQIEVDWIKSPWDVLKYVASISGIALFCVLALGLWKHNWILLVVAFVIIAILKNTMLKPSSSADNNY